MAKTFCGHLGPEDPLYGYLQYDVLPHLGHPSPRARWRVWHLGGNGKDIFLYEDSESPNRVIGKFFASRPGRRDGEHAGRAAAEHRHLLYARGLGLSSPPHTVVRPLGCNPWLSGLLVLEHCRGETLGSVIDAAVGGGGRGRLFRKLTALAWFLATLHNRSADGSTVNFDEDCLYLEGLVGALGRRRLLREGEAWEIARLRDRWRGEGRMWEDSRVMVHGDATPSNFLVGRGLDVVALDLERMKRADRVFDVGRIAGELQHFFLRGTGSREGAEPFVGHFLWEYACHFPDREAAFRSVTGRVPFHMGMTLLRIARNSWLDLPYRRRLVDEAKGLLGGLP